MARSTPELMHIDLLHGWSFKTDPSGKQDWSAPSLDDHQWDVIDAGQFWQKAGYDGYSGVAWYRRSLDVPNTWAGRKAFLTFGSVNDQYQVYVDGRAQGQPQLNAVNHPTTTAVELTPGKPNHIAVKVRSGHNFGGIAKAPVVLATTPDVPPQPQAQAMDYAKSHPDGVWPSWMAGQGRSWTVVGLPQGGPESLQGPDGSWEATSASPAVSAWLVDRANGKLLKPAGAQWSLMDGHLPIVTSAWAASQIKVSTQLWQQDAAAQWHVHVHNDGPARDVSLFVAVRPYQVQPGVAPVFSISYSGSSVVANGRTALVTGDRPSRVEASTGDLGDMSMLAAAGQDSGFQAAEDGAGLASLALIYDLHLGQGGDHELAFAAPTTAGGTASIVHDSKDAAQRWRELLKPGAIELPDKRVTDAYYASLAYILMSNDGGALHPGPLLHDAFWYRDSSYMLAALERNGNLSQARAFMDALTRFQTADGEFPANVSTHTQAGHRRGDPEWDSQGEGIHTLVEYYRFAHDKAWLKAHWPAIDKAAGWLEGLIGSGGLLPPGRSAEDLGPADQRHFWDDFWGVIGFRDAAFAASTVGEMERAKQLQAQGDALLKATLAAGQPGLQREGIFPNGPGSRETPADARGTSPAVWPGQLLQDSFARAQFKGYFDRFITPYGGAFRHENNNFWPFGGLEIAHASLFLGMPDQTNYILKWQLDHQTAKGVWAWGDEVSQDGSRLLGGDMPHGWTAAEYVDLVRDMLLYESGDTLELAAGVPAEWLPVDKQVVVKDLATHFGPVSYELRRSSGKLTLDIHAASPPPGGYDLRLPFQLDQITIDGASPLAVSAQPIHLAPSTKHVELHPKES